MPRLARSERRNLTALVAFCSAALLTACAGPAGPETVADLDADQRQQLQRMLAEEDRRPSAADADALRTGLSSEVPLMRGFAVRGLGRLEDPAALQYLGPLLEDPVPAVRAQAASAVAQSVFEDASETAVRLLGERLDDEADPRVRGVLARALGRLRYVDPAAAATTQTRLIALTRDAPVETLLPTLRGLEWLARTNDFVFDDASRTRLVELTRYGRRGAEGAATGDQEPASEEQAALAARVRRLAMATLRGGDALDADTVETSLYDADLEVRRLAAAASGTVPDEERMPVLIEIALADSAGAVRVEGLRWYGRRLRPLRGCQPIVDAIGDDDPHVSLQAIDLLAQGCRPGSAAENDPDVVALLEQIATEPSAANEWHQPAHALLALARLDAAAATGPIGDMASHPTWQARMYAARAAGVAGSVDVLENLAGDPDPNVAAAAIAGLAELGAGTAPAALVALERDDYQLLITAADALEATTEPGARAALAAALARITSQRRETSRDPRLALVERLAELGGPVDAETLRPYLLDFDPRVAERAAETLEAWGIADAIADPQPLTLQPFPSIEELLALEGSSAIFEMAEGGSFAIELYPFEAPTNVARFARQAEAGYFEGLTFHRVVPNFVVQGGSPGANEYVGDGPYSRDELGMRSHLRGTVGISTRGRDTGDSQIFINLVDNVRLDHAYTIIGTVTRGMDVVDAVLEGAKIARVTVEPAGAND